MGGTGDPHARHNDGYELIAGGLDVGVDDPVGVAVHGQPALVAPQHPVTHLLDRVELVRDEEDRAGLLDTDQVTAATDRLKEAGLGVQVESFLDRVPVAHASARST